MVFSFFSPHHSYKELLSWFLPNLLRASFYSPEILVSRHDPPCIAIKSNGSRMVL